MKKIFIILMFLVIAGISFKIAPNYTIGVRYEKDEIRVVLDNKEITKEMPQKAVIKDGKIMFSRATVDKYFDKYLYFDEKYNTIITTTDTVVSKLTIDEKKIQINNEIKDIDVPAQIIDEQIYIPIEELQEVYEIEVVQNEKVIITSKNRNKHKIYVGSDINMYKLKTSMSRKVGEIYANEPFYYYGQIGKGFENEWIYVRNERGDLGYIDPNEINVINCELQLIDVELLELEKSFKKKINLVWEYAENYTPDRSSEGKIEGLNVVSPTWFYLKNTDGDVISKIDKSYLTWAKKNGYEVWPAFKNDFVNIEETSAVVTDMKIREKTINQIVKLAKDNKLDGINIDFENMKQKDVNEFSQFVRELSAMLRANDIIPSVDVTVPDGSPTWSLCYNRKELNDAVDYIILMAYDQHGVSSKNAGSVAALNWVETNINKMLNLGVEKEKLVLGIPFYSRLWAEKGDKVSSYAVGMKDQKYYFTLAEEKWLEEEGQYYLEYKMGDSIVKLWAEEEKSIAEKVKLAKKYGLAGVAAWRRGYETDNIWKVINDNLK